MSSLGQLQRYLIANRHARDEQQVVRTGSEEPSLTIGDLRSVFASAIEAQRATTVQQGVVHESAVPEGQTPSTKSGAPG